ncbi:HAD family hydrolase [Ornithinimicrobium pekingense]|uniref:HAD family hydrolase n=1 Tax=Ornithinimicrobium pekingense TaxID=384677 RepID=A0ABQ2F6I7_9MICO|nr:HAD family hydrolase [Ornithinimicrobium pekingense]GGK62840.1 hypothetical protein GCM10011509_09100 [Ornithinimicrobium pekingense]
MTHVVPPPAGLRGVLLDVDDTLLGTREAMHLAATRAARQLWPDADPDRLERAGHRFRDDPGGHFRAFTRGEHDFATMRALRVRDLGRWLGRAASPEDLARWDELYEDAFTTALRAFDDVVNTLQECHRRGLRVALLTNSSGDYTRAKLTRAGLADVVERLTAGTVTKDTLGIGKPAPEVFHHGCGLLGLDPGQVVYVGDELDVDTCAALGAGLGAAWLRRPGYERDPDEVSHAATHGLVAAETLREVLDALG